MSVKLILTDEVDGLGEPGDVVEVKPGYARNYLLPRGLATAWTRGGQAQVAQIRRARLAREVRDEVHAREVAELLAAGVVITARVGANGRLFGSITAADVVTAVGRAGGPMLDRRSIVLDQPIRLAGRHRVAVRLHPAVTAEFDLTVVDEAD